VTEGCTTRCPLPCLQIPCFEWQVKGALKAVGPPTSTLEAGMSTAGWVPDADHDVAVLVLALEGRT